MNERKEIVTTADGSFIVHMHVRESRFAGVEPNTAQATVYSGQAWGKFDGSESGVGYSSKSIGGLHNDQLDDDAREMFVMTCRYPGCWDERVYAKDNEYWGGELAQMAEVEAIIKPMLRKMVQEVHENAAKYG